MGSASKNPRMGGLKQGQAAGNFKGVRMKTWGKWVSEIRKPQSKERIWLGSYDTAEKAARAYDAALYCLRGPQGKFNFYDNERPKIPSNLQDPLSTSEIKAVAASFASLVTAINPPEVVNMGVEVESTFDVDSLSGAGDSGPYTIFSSECLSVLSSTSPVTAMNPPEVVNMGVEVESTFDVDSLSGAGDSSPCTFFSSECLSVLSSTSVGTAMNPPEVVNMGVEEESTFDVDSLSGAGDSGPYTFFSDSFLLDELITFERDSIWAVLEETKNLNTGAQQSEIY